ncbi:hypothetical protein BLNAU_13307 [Blattamonas nauphoetae]|uniref:Uncharacterized protein n=1 Tax=Blattamonas nauphoetae TaxID=2049346 RepID=A0ABQ9XJQ8_9EUKA|nr:hypothetical protein BLNAU_13307 [Blattamonas nauphoetae]
MVPHRKERGLLIFLESLSPPLVGNSVSANIINLAFPNENPAPPVVQPPEPRLILKTKKELFNEMKAQNPTPCSYSTFMKQITHLKMARRRTDVCQYCEAGKKLERKRQTIVSSTCGISDSTEYLLQ